MITKDMKSDISFMRRIALNIHHSTILWMNAKLSRATLISAVGERRFDFSHTKSLLLPGAIVYLFPRLHLVSIQPHVYQTQG
jgi:hypothetical protein